MKGIFMNDVGWGYGTHPTFMLYARGFAEGRGNVRLEESENEAETTDCVRINMLKNINWWRKEEKLWICIIF